VPLGECLGKPLWVRINAGYAQFFDEKKSHLRLPTPGHQEIRVSYLIDHRTNRPEISKKKAVATVLATITVCDLIISFWQKP
jgi:hypothetical protein